ncbi:MAG: hypothetical protein LLF76_02700 [Planctomycetaceae bacterium]|nr:hypothetical protein [Planctomycetaceae bacterium]
MRLLENWLFLICLCAIAFSIASLTPLGERHLQEYGDYRPPVYKEVFSESSFMLLATIVMFTCTLAVACYFYVQCRTIVFAMLLGGSAVIVTPIYTWPAIHDNILLFMRCFHLALLLVATVVIVKPTMPTPMSPVGLIRETCARFEAILKPWWQPPPSPDPSIFAQSRCDTKPLLQINDEIQHARFGHGVVVGFKNNSGGNPVSAKVQFDSGYATFVGLRGGPEIEASVLITGRVRDSENVH